MKKNILTAFVAFIIVLLLICGIALEQYTLDIQLHDTYFVFSYQIIFFWYAFKFMSILTILLFFKTKR